MGAYIEADIRSYAQRVIVPTLVIQGARDQLVLLAWAEELAQAIPSAQLAIIEGGSHSLMIRHAEARRQVMDFMQKIRYSPPAPAPAYKQSNRPSPPEAPPASPECDRG